jgi:hypothetical protein
MIVFPRKIDDLTERRPCIELLANGGVERREMHQIKLSGVHIRSVRN